MLLRASESEDLTRLDALFCFCLETTPNEKYYCYKFVGRVLLFV